MYTIHFSKEAKEKLKKLRDDNGKRKRFKAVTKAIKNLQKNPFYSALRTHPYKSLLGPNGEKIWQSYAENNTPGAYRIFWYYGPKRKEITIKNITPHP